MTPKPSTPIDDLIVETTGTIDRLIALLDQETEAATAQDMDLVSSLQQRKALLAEAHLRNVQALNQRGAEAKQADPGVLEDFAAARDELGAALQDNLRALDIARSAAQRVFTIIAESARRAAHPVDNYSAEGITPAAGPPHCTSVALDRRY
ncbi:MAG: hypothetical protein GVY13_11980 [Alphaproteobacteria bacterium]|jgi:hypothetical protein|nr:hypothetical protein [Alphaproteobacteria bacterium]